MPKQLPQEGKYALFMKGSVNFTGFMAQKFTPNDKFYVTTYLKPQTLEFCTMTF
jgi:hypothetical protein